MTAGDPKDAKPALDPGTNEETEAPARDAAGEILSPAMPPVGAGLMLDIDPRLNRESETEKELKELVESNEDAEREEGEDVEG